MHEEIEQLRAELEEARRRNRLMLGLLIGGFVLFGGVGVLFMMSTAVRAREAEMMAREQAMIAEERAHAEMLAREEALAERRRAEEERSKADTDKARIKGDISHALVESHLHLGDAQLRNDDLAGAEESYRSGYETAQKSATSDPKNARAQHDVFVSCLKLGNLYQGQFAFAKAVEWYEKGLKVSEALPQNDDSAREVKELNESLAFCRTAHAALGNVDVVLKQPAAEVSRWFEIRVRTFATKNDCTNLVATAQVCEAVATKDNKQAYTAARAWSLASGLAEVDAKLKEEHAVKAITLLKKTPTGEGHTFESPAKLAAHMKQDKDLDPIRERADFQKLLESLMGSGN